MLIVLALAACAPASSPVADVPTPIPPVDDLSRVLALAEPCLPEGVAEDVRLEAGPGGTWTVGRRDGAGKAVYTVVDPHSSTCDGRTASASASDKPIALSEVVATCWDVADRGVGGTPLVRRPTLHVLPDRRGVLVWFPETEAVTAPTGRDLLYEPRTGRCTPVAMD